VRYRGRVPPRGRLRLCGQVAMATISQGQSLTTWPSRVSVYQPFWMLMPVPPPPPHTKKNTNKQRISLCTAVAHFHFPKAPMHTIKDSIASANEPTYRPSHCAYHPQDSRPSLCPRACCPPAMGCAHVAVDYWHYSRICISKLAPSCYMAILR
jgi:hypothetical protein